VPGIASAGDSFGELRGNVQEAITLYLETAKEYKESIPAFLQSEYTLDYKFDIQAFMEWMSKVMSQRGLSEVATINESLLSQYAHGVKKPSPKQLKRIETALHRFADDLQAISF